MKVPPSAKGPPTTRQTIRALQEAIEEAVQSGADVKSLTLRLTLRDEAGLRRDTESPVEAISYTGGEMRFWGVKVVKGGVEKSALEGV